MTGGPLLGGAMADAVSMDRQRRAEQLADEVLFPAAAAVDAAERVPSSHFDILAEQGFYDLTGVEFAAAGAILEALASGCLATAFVWLQHHTAVRLTAPAGSPGHHLHDRLRRGRLRAGIAFGGLRPGAQGLRIRRGDGDLRLDGDVPWVTGWDLIDLVVVGALDDAGTVHFVLMDAVAAPTLTVTPLELVAANASRTVTLRFADHPVPAARDLATEPHDEWLRSEASGSAFNGFLALGVARRCLLLNPSDELERELAVCREALVRAAPEQVPAARAAASALAVRAAARLMVHSGSRAVLAGHHASRLVREAAFLLVFGTRPAIRDELLRTL